MENKTEVRSGSKKENLKQTLEYIDEREKNLSRYSDKLRKNVQAIVELFGNPYQCRVCGREEKKGPHHTYTGRKDYNGYETIDETRMILLPKEELPVGKWGKDGTEYVYLTPHQHVFQEKTYVSFDIEDQESFYDEEDDAPGMWRHALQFRNSVLGCVKWNPDVCMVEFLNLDELSREKVKELIRSGRIPAFLTYVAERLQQAEKDYEEVASVAEKMVQSIEG